MSDNNTTETTENSIEQALAAAKAARTTESTSEAPTTVEAPATTRPAKTDEEKAAEKAEMERIRAEKKAEREAKRAEKKAEYERQKAERAAERARKKAERDVERANYTPHMAKVEKAAENLPELSNTTDMLVTGLTELSNSDLSAVIAYAEHILRVNSTTASQDYELTEGQLVEVTSGAAQYLGLTGTVSELRRIRVLVDVPGRDKPIYLFRSDCTPVEGEVAESADEDTSGAEDSESAAS